MFTNAIAKLDAKFQSAPIHVAMVADRESRIDPIEHMQFQEIKSLRFAEGAITLDVANWLYETLGRTSDVFNSRSVGTRLVALTLIKGAE